MNSFPPEIAGVTDPGYNAVATGADRGSSLEATVKIRYNHPGTSASITSLENDRARIRLHAPQRAVTPGQAAVIYDGDVVLGGGWICRRATERIRCGEREEAVLA